MVCRKLSIVFLVKVSCRMLTSLKNKISKSTRSYLRIAGFCLFIIGITIAFPLSTLSWSSFTLVIVSIIWAAAIVYRYRFTAVDIFSPFFLTMSFFFLLYILVPIYYVSDPRFPEHLRLKANLMIAIGLISFLMGFSFRHIVKICKISPRPLNFYPIHNKNLLKIAIPLFILGVSIYYILLRKTSLSINDIYFNILDFRRASTSGGQAYLLLSSYFCLTLCCVLWFTRIILTIHINPLEKIIFAIVSLIAFALILSFGLRSYIIQFFISFLICQHYFKKKVSITLLSIFMLLMISFIAIYGAYRVMKSPNMVTLLEVSSSKNQNLFRFIIEMNIHRLNAYPTFVDLLKFYKVSDKDFLYGSTALSLLLRPIPRTYLPDKPLETGPLITRWLYPQAANADIAFAPSLLGEMYINFSVFGIIFGFFLLGLLVCILEYLISHTNSMAAVWFHSLSWSIPFNWLSSGFNGPGTIFGLLSAFYVLTILIIMRRL